MARTSETKFVSDYGSILTTSLAQNVFTSFNGQIYGGAQWFNCLPQLLEGTGDYQRVGSKISPRQVKVAVDVRIKPDGENFSTQYPKDLTVVVYYGYCKRFTTFGDVDANSGLLSNQLLRLGGVGAAGGSWTGSETKAFEGVVSDSHLVINNDIWHLRKKTFRLYKAAGYLNGTSVINTNGTLNAPNKNSHSFMLDFGSMCPKTLTYNAATDASPMNWAPVFSMGYYYNDRTIPDDGSTDHPALLEYRANKFLTFKDD